MKYLDPKFAGPGSVTDADRDRHEITFRGAKAGDPVKDYTCPICNKYALRDLLVTRHCTVCGWEGIRPDNH